MMRVMSMCCSAGMLSTSVIFIDPLRYHSLVLKEESHVKTFENGELVDTTIRRCGDYDKKTPW